MSKATNNMRLTPAQVAQVYGHSREFWVKLIASGELVAYDERRPGALVPRWMIDPVDVEAWRERRRYRIPQEQPGQTVTVKQTKGFSARMREARQRKRAAALARH